MAVAVLALCSAAHAQVPADAPAPERAATGQARADDIRALDQQVQTVLAEARRQQELLAVQRERLAQAEAATAWLPWLSVAVIGLAGLAGWLGWRVWRLQRHQVQAPQPPAAEPAPDDDPAALDMAALVAAAMPDGLAPRRGSAGVVHAPTACSACGSDRGAGAPRAVAARRCGRQFVLGCA